MLMAKKIRFPLEMDGGVEVRDIDSLRKHFSLQRVMGYLADGKLITWLRDRYANDLADAIEAVDRNDESLARRICEILGVDFDEEAEENIEKAEERNKKLARLKEVTLEKEFLDNVDNVALEQDDLYDLLDEGVNKIYLCGDRFSIPLSKEGVSYIGINNPVVAIDSKVEIDWKEKKIALSGVKFDSKYQEVVESAEDTKRKLYQKAVENVTGKVSNQHKSEIRTVVSYGKYKDDSYINFMLTPADKKESEKSFCILAKEVSLFKYNVDDDIQNAKKILVDSGIVNLAKKYLKSL